jgi:hypothetical protein
MYRQTASQQIQVKIIFLNTTYAEYQLFANSS